MILNKDEFTSIKPQNNFVLTKSIQDTSEVKFNTKILKINTDFHPENHVNVVHRVVALPKRLIYSRKLNNLDSMEWKTEMLLKKNDKVWVNYLAVLKSHRISYNNETYYLIPYQSVYLTVRPWDYVADGYYIIVDVNTLDKTSDISKIFDIFKSTGVIIFNPRRGGEPVITNSKESVTEIPDNIIVKRKKTNKNITISYHKVIMLNGYVLIEPITETLDTKLWLPKKEKERFGFMRYEGVPNDEYWDKIYFDDHYPNIGDMIHLAYVHNKKLENVVHTEFPDGKNYYITQRRRMLGVVKNAKMLAEI